MKSKRIKIAVVVALAAAVLLMAIGYIVKSRETPATKNLPQPIVGALPEEVWSDEPEEGFTTREEIGSVEGSIGILTIEKIGVSVHVFDSGNVMEDMIRGASHYRSTSYWDGNVGFAAHIGNASYSYFDRLHELVQGDIITYETSLGIRHYAVTTIVEIAETDWSYLRRTADNRVTLTTCIEGKPEMRLCVQAVEIQ